MGVGRDDRRGGAAVPAGLLVPTSVVLLSIMFALAGPARSAGAQACGPAPAGRVAVMVVVDTGSAAVNRRCTVVTHGATGLDALRAAGHQVRLDGGFVCAIDGLPATGCGNKPDAGPAYWRYWHAPPGGGPWSYSQVGAGGYRLPARCATEGWVWSDSPSSDTPPRVAAPALTCEAAPSTSAPTSSAPPAAPSSVAPPVGSGSGSTASGGVSSGAGSGSSTQAAPGSAQAAPVAGPEGGSVASPPNEVASETTIAEEPDGSDVSDPVARDGSDAQGPDDTDGAGGAPVEESARGTERDGGGGPPWGVVMAAVLILGIGGTALVRSRVSPEGP